MPEFQFSGVSDFLSMGGYGLYVWSVYLLFALFLLINIIPPLLSRGRTMRQYQAKLLRAESHHQQRARSDSSQANTEKKEDV